MHIITSVPKYDKNAIHKAKQEMLNKGLEKRLLTEKNRHMQAAREAKSLREHHNKNLGRPVAVFPGWEYFRLTQKYGIDEVLSDEFLKDYNKRFKELSPYNL